MESVFRGSEALANGRLTRAKLRWNYRRIFPDIYVPATHEPTFRDLTVGAWLWSRGNAVVAGSAAAALHGAQCFSETGPIELIWRRGRPPSGITVRNESIEADEITQIDGMLVTTPARTALDLARHLPRRYAVCYLDSLARATDLRALDVVNLALRYEKGRHMRYALENVVLMDPGAETPYATIVRLLLRERWAVPPRTQLRVSDGDEEMFVDVGYAKLKVGLDAEGKRFAQVYKPRSSEMLPEFARRVELADRSGWIYIYVLCEDSIGGIWQRVSNAFEQRGFTPGRGWRIPADWRR